MSNQSDVVDFNVDDVCRRFSVIYTGAISDVLDEMGCRNRSLPSEIQALEMGQRVAGLALTVEGEPTDSQDPEVIFIPVLRMLGSIQPGDVIVSQPNDATCAHLGELSSEVARYRGARGAVIDGGARDIDYILKLGLPVFCRYRTPVDIQGRWRLKSCGQPIQIGQVQIRRGDFIVGDHDGVLVIPKEITLEVLHKAEAVMSTENLVRRDVLTGVHPVDAFRKYGRF